MKLRHFASICILASALIGITQQASAATDTWYLGSGCSGRCSNDDNSYTSSNNGIEATVTAWGNSDTGNTYEQRSLYSYSGGLGSGEAEGESAPQHAIDNNGVHEFILIQYDFTVALEELYLSYIYNDADISVLAYNGTSFNVNNDLAGLTTSGVNSGDWTKVSNIDINSTGTWTSINNNSNVSSQYWLVGAYSSVFSGALSESGGLIGGNDYFKLKKVSGTKVYTPPGGSVPVPGTIALVGLGLLLVRARRGATYI